MRVGLIASLVCLFLVGLANADPAHASIRKTTDIPAEELGSALQTVAKDYDFQVLYRTEIVKDLRTQGAVGSLTSDEALGKVLKGTGLSYKYLDANTVTVYPTFAGSASSTSSPASAGSAGGADQNGGGKKSSQDFRVAQVDQGKSASASSITNSTSNSRENANSPSPGLAEIIVTAQKKSERLQDVPIPISVIDANQLTESNQTRLEDYFATVPGLTFQNGFGTTLLAIRGLTTAQSGNPTVGIVIDDVPYGATINPGYGPYAPDIDPGDVARIEVLRGPQGVLYGASSLGGLIKYVTIDPTTEGVSGRLQVGSSGVQNGDELGYSLRGSVNVPLSDTLAIRASGFTRLDPGFLDNIQSGQRAVNETESNGGRLAALWQPSDVFSLKLSALIQDINDRGADFADLSLGGGLDQNVLRGTGGNDRKTQAYSATITTKLGDAEIVSLTGYSTDKDRLLIDGGSYYDMQAAGFFQVDGSSISNELITKKFSQEVRASLPIGQLVQWSVGAFYTNEKFDSEYEALANDRTTAAVAGSMLTILGPATYDEYAIFTNVTFNITNNFDVQVGGRESQINQTFSTVRYGPLSEPFYGSDPSVIPEFRPKDNPFNYLLTPRYRISPDLMIYARFASGYRPGGANINCNSETPCQYKSDKTQNYELGFKGDVLNRLISFDASLYYIRWKDVQIPLADVASNFNFYTDNAGLAKSQGLELSVEAKPVTGMTISAWFDYDNAELITAFPPTSSAYGNAGDRLPYSSQVSGNVALNEEFPLWNRSIGFLGGSVSYVGGRIGAFQQGPIERDYFPAYTQVNLRAGLKYAQWTFDAYVNNAANTRGIIASGSADIGQDLVNYIRPRTIGLNISRIFGR